MKCQCHTISRGTVDAPMPLVYLPDSQGPGKGQAVRRAAHLSRWSHDKHVSNLEQGSLQNLQTFGVNSVVVCQENASHNICVRTSHACDQLKTSCQISLLVKNNG